ncbi:MAG TPA: hypothetical protein VM553_06650 [Dongiaceae bacterium]|nr:hypothetical protein [Dongiaceae bacterium]
MTATAAAIDGAWNFVVKTPTGEQKSVITLKSNGDQLTGTMNSAEYGVQDIEDGKYDGETLTWKSKTTKPMKLTLTYTGTVDASGNLKGFIKVAMAKLQFTGTPIAK